MLFSFCIAPSVRVSAHLRRRSAPEKRILLELALSCSGNAPATLFISMAVLSPKMHRFFGGRDSHPRLGFSAHSLAAQTLCIAADVTYGTIDTYYRPI
jgi:hypothetical protein